MLENLQWKPNFTLVTVVTTLNAPTHRIDKRKLDKLSKQIAASAKHSWTIMEFCGGQTGTFLDSGLSQLLPDNVNIVHGPGCAICATPKSIIDCAVEIAKQDSVVLCAGGDLLRLRGQDCDLLELKAQGKDVRVVHTPLDALSLARELPEKQIVYLSVGFDMTAHVNALAVWQARRMELNNFFLLGYQGYVPAVVARILEEPRSQVQAIFGLGDVCTVSGLSEFEPISHRFKVPIVVTGAEPLDLLQAIKMCVELLECDLFSVENQFKSGISRQGNREGKSLIKEVFELIEQEWRGLGLVQNGGYRLKAAFQRHDALKAFGLQIEHVTDSPVCISRQILFGFKKPPDCPAFGKSCRPGSALGATMVSSDGVCASYFEYAQRHGLA